MFTAVNLLKKLKTYVSSLREKFIYFENKARILSTNILPCVEKSVRKKKLSDGTVEGNSNFCGTRKLEVDIFYVIIDRLVTELDKKLNAFDNVCNIFGFITKFGSELLSETFSDIVISTFKDDVNTTKIKQEIVHFSNYVMHYAVKFTNKYSSKYLLICT